MKRFFCVLFVMIFLISCGAPADTTADNVTDAPTIIDTSETNVPETEAPEDNTPDEVSAFTGVSSVGEGKYKVNFENGYSVIFDGKKAEEIFEEIKQKGYLGSVLGFLTASAFEVDMIADVDTGCKTLGKAMAKMLESCDKYFDIKGLEKSKVIDIVKTPDFYVNSDGKSYPEFTSTHLAYTQLFEVSAGDEFTLLADGVPMRMYRVVAFRNGATNDAMLGKEVMSYKVSGDTTHIIVSFVDENKEYKASITNEKAIVKPSLKKFVDDSTILQLATGDSGRLPDLSESKAVLKNDYLKLQSNHIINDKTLVLTFNTSGLNDGEVIGLGHGEQSYGGSGIEITKDRINTYNYAAGRRTNLVNEEHGIDISGNVTVIIKTGLRAAVVTIDNGKDIYTSTDFQWFGRNGEIFAKSVGVELKDVKLEWSCDAYKSDVWFFGDSYFDTTTTARWPYYMVEDGYTDVFLNGYPGRKTQAALEDFKKALEFAIPKYVVWCLGMNNGDSEKGMNANYKNATNEMLALCKENDITPILCTIPNVPTVINIYKNEWIKTSGYRYVDFAASVGAEEKGSSWTAGMLGGDGVHTAPSGAKAHYDQLKKDIADILVK